MWILSDEMLKVSKLMKGDDSLGLAGFLRKFCDESKFKMCLRMFWNGLWSFKVIGLRIEVLG